MQVLAAIGGEVMNRAERRRQQRSEARKKIPVLMVGDGIVATELPGHTFEAKGGAQLPTKVPGRHRWVATAGYVLNDVQVRTAFDPEALKYLDHENLMFVGIGCWDCEQPLGQIDVESTCPAPGDD